MHAGRVHHKTPVSLMVGWNHKGSSHDCRAVARAMHAGRVHHKTPVSLMVGWNHKGSSHDCGAAVPAAWDGWNHKVPGALYNVEP